MRDFGAVEGINLSELTLRVRLSIVELRQPKSVYNKG